MPKIDIEGIDKAELLVALYDASSQIGLGLLQPNKNLTVEEAREILKKTQSFDYIWGRSVKVDFLKGNILDAWLYDQDFGKGAAQRVVDKLRQRSN